MRVRAASVVALVGGITMVIGSYSDWVVVRGAAGGPDLTVVGTDGDGRWTAILGAAVLGFAIGTVVKALAIPTRLGLIAVGLICLVVALANLLNLAGRLPMTPDTMAAPGLGLYLVVAGSLMTVAAGIAFAAWHPSIQKGPK